jgi:hypothetical protein
VWGVSGCVVVVVGRGIDDPAMARR